MTPTEIREARLRLGLSQAKLARLLPVETDTVAKWEAGRRKPHPLLVRALRDLERELTTAPG